MALMQTFTKTGFLTVSPVPKFVGGITNTFSYKGFDLNILFSFAYGNDIYDDAAKYQIGELASSRTET